MKREVETRPIYECRCDERLKSKTEESTRLAYTWLLGELLEIYGCLLFIKRVKRELKTRPIYECRCDERLKTKAEDVNRRDVCECDG